MVTASTEWTGIRTDQSSARLDSDDRLKRRTSYLLCLRRNKFTHGQSPVLQQTKTATHVEIDIFRI